MKQRLKELKDRLATEKGELRRIEKDLAEAQASVVALGQRRDDALKARGIIQLVAKQTQQKLEYHIGGLVSTALAAVFEDSYEFVVRFVERRGRTECDLLFRKGEEECSPLDASGGGAMDVASFALNVAFLSLERPKSRRVLILDERFRFVAPDLQSKVSKMLREISKRPPGLQIIMVSHADEIIDAADRVFEVVKVGGVSQVKRV